MAKKPHRRRSKGRPRKSGGKSSASSVSARRSASGGGWVLVHPRCAVDRSEDLEEVQLMIDAGELEVAVDEVRWLLSGCSDSMAAHVLAGELAVEMGPDPPLARGHFGYAYQLGVKALRAANAPNGPLPASELANQSMHRSARGLAWCLEKLGQPDKANEVAAHVRKLDPADPMGVAAMLDDLRSGGLPVVGLE